MSMAPVVSPLQATLVTRSTFRSTGSGLLMNIPGVISVEVQVPPSLAVTVYVPPGRLGKIPDGLLAETGPARSYMGLPDSPVAVTVILPSLSLLQVMSVDPKEVINMGSGPSTAAIM